MNFILLLSVKFSFERSYFVLVNHFALLFAVVFISTIWWWPTYFSEDLKFLIHLIFVCACIIFDSTLYSALGSCQPLLCRVLSFSLMEVDFTVVILGDSVALRSNFVTHSWFAARFSLQAWMIYTRYLNNDCYVYLYFLFCLNWEFVWYWSFIMFIFSLEIQKQFLWLLFLFLLLFLLFVRIVRSSAAEDIWFCFHGIIWL